MRIEWKEIPKEQTIYQIAARYPGVKPKGLEVFLKLMWVTAQLERALEAHFVQHGLSRGRFMLLILLYKDLCGIEDAPAVEGEKRTPGAMSPSELAARLDVTRGNMTGLIDGLEREGWIRREDHPEDRRGLLISLTDVGRERMETMFPTHYRRMGLLLSKLTTAESEAVLGVIPKLVTGMEQFLADIEQTSKS